MALSIPDEVFAAYTDGMNLFFEKFGTVCKLVYLKNVSVSSLPNLKNKLLQNPFGPTGSKRGDESIVQEEVTEDVTLRVYFDKKSISKVSGINIQDVSCMTIGPLTFLEKSRQCAYLIIGANRYERHSTPQSWGLDGQYAMCLWKQI